MLEILHISEGMATLSVKLWSKSAELCAAFQFQGLNYSYVWKKSIMGTQSAFVDSIIMISPLILVDQTSCVKCAHK